MKNILKILICILLLNSCNVNKNYLLTFNSNTNLDSGIRPIYLNAGTKYSLPFLNKPGLANKPRFLGWDTNSKAVKPYYLPYSIFVMPYNDIQLFAIYGPY